ncbi:MAG: glucose-1-phosphate cytidylyltransferase [Candidatus Pelagibacter sp.]|nr:glucose-1-phosphate cytidylyltransferase [Candidatus Pelagibacter sp.]
MKVVILCGGFGSRLGHETNIIPKPMVKIDKDPIIVHILKQYYKYGYKEFILALGYKGEHIRNFFKKKKFKFKVQTIFTGRKTLTGGRLLKLKKYLKKEKNFMLTYGDGISNQNIRNLTKFHLKHKKTATMTVVRPPVRFGEVTLQKDKVVKFMEKPQIKTSWINGGFFVFSNKIFNYLSSLNEMLERKPMEKLFKKKELMAFKHHGFWQCMDTQRDKELLAELIRKKNAPWMK